MTPALVAVAGGKLLAPAAAASVARMNAARGRALAITSAYRDPRAQAQLYAGWVARLPGYNYALPPGLSVHEKGRAADFGPSGYTWLEAHAAAHGWRRTNPAERWHYEYDVTRDRHLADVVPAPRPPTPAAPPAWTPPPLEDDVMATRHELREDLDAALGPVLAMLRAGAGPRTVYQLNGTTAAWLDLGTCRRYLSRAAYIGLGEPRITELYAMDLFWRLPSQLGDPGELLRVTGTAAAYQLDAGALRWIDGPTYAALWPAPPITDLPPGDPVWTLPRVGVSPDAA